MVEWLRAAGVAVEPHSEPHPNGLFAELEDPEGNRIQLWSQTRPRSPAIRAAARQPCLHPHLAHVEGACASRLRRVLLL